MRIPQTIANWKKATIRPPECRRFSRFSNMECRVHSLMQNTSDHNPIRTIIQSASQIVEYMCSRSTAASSMLDVERSNAFSNVISVPGAGPLRSFGYHQGGFFNK